MVSVIATGYTGRQGWVSMIQSTIQYRISDWLTDRTFNITISPNDIFCPLVYSQLYQFYWNFTCAFRYIHSNVSNTIICLKDILMSNVKVIWRSFQGHAKFKLEKIPVFSHHRPLNDLWPPLEKVKWYDWLCGLQEVTIYTPHAKFVNLFFSI